MNDAQPFYVPTHGTIEQARTKISRFALDHGLPLLCYTALAILLTWPLVWHLGDALPATPGEGAQDLWQNVWNLWWAGEALRRGQSFFFTDALFYPQGASLLFHPLNLTSGLLAVPLRTAAGTIAAYNLLVLLSFVLSGYAVFLLARRHNCGRAAALLGGLAYTGSTFHFFHLRLGHLEQISMQWLPLYALALDAVLRPTNDQRSEERGARSAMLHLRSSIFAPRSSSFRSSVGKIVLATLALLALIFTSLYMALYAALLTGVWVAWMIVEAWAGPHRPIPPALPMGAVQGLRASLLNLGAVILLTLLIVGPTLLIPMAHEVRQVAYMVPSIDATIRGSALPADVLLPPAAHPLRALVALPEPYSAGAFVGYLALALALYGAVARLRPAVRWLALIAIAWALSLGPALPFYRLLSAFPPLQVSRYPDRFALLMLLGVAVMAALGAAALLARLRGWARLVVAAALLGLMLLELYPGTLPLIAPPDNPFYHTMARDRDQFSVLELPISRPNSAWLAMYAQTIHGHPILDGALARAVPHVPFSQLALMRQLERPSTPPDIVVEPPAARVAALRFFKLRYVIYHRAGGSSPLKPLSPNMLSQVTGVPVSQVYADDELVAYRLDVPDGQAALPAVAAIGDGWYDLEGSGPEAHRWLQPGGGGVQLYAPQDETVTLRLKLASYQEPRRLDIYLDNQPIGQVEAQPSLTETSTPSFQMRAGPHILRLVPSGPGISPDAAGAGADDRPLTVAVFQLEVE